MYSDAYFYGKSGYEPCQDYAIAFPGDVRLSDGCGSCQRSDIGSRLLCLYGGDAEQLSILLKENVFFNQEDFYATYLSLKVNGFNDIISKVEGDGFLIEVNSKTKQFHYTRYFYPENAPKYPIYEFLDKSVMEEWKKQFPDNYRESEYYYNNDKIDFSKSIELESINPNIYLISSDGLESFVDSNGSKIPFQDVIIKLIDFKCLNGEFIKRRMIAFRRECDKLGWKNLDDVSVGGISK